jgi:hypothetical protein
MKYIDAGYIIGLSTLFCYAVSLVFRSRRLERAAKIAQRDDALVSGPSRDPVAASPTRDPAATRDT